VAIIAEFEDTNHTSAGTMMRRREFCVHEMRQGQNSANPSFKDEIQHGYHSLMEFQTPDG